MGEFFRKSKWLFQRRRKEDELREELQFHLDQEAEQTDRDAARRELGNLALLREDTRSAWGWTVVEQLFQDLRYAARTMLRNPAFALLATLSLALGIGANTAIYSLMDTLLIRSLPVPDPGSLVVLNWRAAAVKNSDFYVVHSVSGSIEDTPQGGIRASIFPYPAFEALQKPSDVFRAVFARRRARSLSVLTLGQAQVAEGEYVSGDYFRGLNVIPAEGRLIAPSDDVAGAAGAVALSYDFAQRRFGNAAAAIGQPVLINNQPFTAIGVTPPEFFGFDPGRRPDVFLPLHADLVLDPERDPKKPRYLDGNYYWNEIIARLAPGVTREQAQAAAAALFHNWVATTANESERKALPELILTEGYGGLDRLRNEYSRPVFVLMVMVGLLLSIACANIANLLLARATARRREMAVRLSMGAGRWRIVRQLLAESLLLAIVGGSAGVVLAFWGIHFLTVMLASGSNLVFNADLNWRVLAAAFGLTILTGLLFGIAPALQATRVDPMPVLKESRTSDPSRRRFSMSQVLVASQMAISVFLLVAAGLFVRTLSNLQAIDLGFSRDHLLTLRLNARQAGHRDPKILSFYRNLETRFGQIPGVRAVARANNPLVGKGAYGWAVVPSGKKEPEKAPSGHGSGFDYDATHTLSTGPGFFTTLKIPLLAGRDFDERDRLSSAPVAIVNEAWVKINLDGQNPVGRHVTSYSFNDKAKELEIVGVVKNSRYDNLTGRFPAIVYLPIEQASAELASEATYFLRTSADPLAFVPAVREVARQADARIPVTALMTQTAQIEGEMTEQTLFARLCTCFAILALIIACVGLYGTVSYNVARRTGEIGIRMALGAGRTVVVRMILGQVMTLAGCGLAVGVAASVALSRTAQSLLYNVKPNDPLTISIAAGILLIAALFAGYAPARRASRVDPIAALRQE